MIVQTLKGFRDFLPLEVKKRQYVINVLQGVFETYGFDPLETPALEYEEILTGKYGEEGDQLMYRFTDRGDRKVALRYDQTVPLARVVAQYGAKNGEDGQPLLPYPFKRYQIQPVWRADNTQRGRFREFIQCDIDTIGTDSALADADLIATIFEAYQLLGFENFKILVNDRQLFEELTPEAITVIDKMKKIGDVKVCEELVTRNIVSTREEAEKMLQSLLGKHPTERLQQTMALLESLGIDSSFIEFSPTLARGLDYYTGIIIEIESPDYPYGSLGGGGRYNNLIGTFAGREIPAVGFAFGFDRIIDAMDELQLFPEHLAASTTEVLITVFSPDLISNSLELLAKLREQEIAAEIYTGEFKEKNPLEKQLKYANRKMIPYVLIIGPEEAEKQLVTVKNMVTGTQNTLPIDQFINDLQELE